MIIKEKTDEKKEARIDKEKDNLEEVQQEVSKLNNAFNNTEIAELN
jgi:hypothetical protein